MLWPNTAARSYSIGCCRWLVQWVPVSAVYALTLHVTFIFLTRYLVALHLMVSLFRSNVHCFYCNQTLSPRPANLRAFLCPHCECWNRYDKNGGRSAQAKHTLNILLNPLCQEIMSDEPAMHEESLNCASFARRG